MMVLQTMQLEGRNPYEWGQQHGRSFATQIEEIYRIRLRLMLQKTDLQTEDNVLKLASLHLNPFKNYDIALYDELRGIAEGARLSVEQLIVLNHYTDLRDLSQAHLMHTEGCSAVVSSSSSGRVLAQTWDMHGTATPYALLMEIPGLPEGAAVQSVNAVGIPQHGKTVVFTIMGCLGMTGMTSWGLGLTINNLNSIDARIGVVWPAIVRKALRQSSAAAAAAVLKQAPIGSGRHFIVADHDYVEAIAFSGTTHKVLLQDSQPSLYFHTNHCVDEEMAQTCKIPANSTTLQRYDTLAKLAATQPKWDAQTWFVALEAVGLPMNEQKPDEPATCGAIAMDLENRVITACAGIPGTHADALVVEVT